MRKLRCGIMALLLLICASAAFGSTQVSIGVGIGLPNVSIGFNMSNYPELAPIPGYPVYYAPRLNSNYFFYDGMYWVYTDDYWYASSWYNGPWSIVEPAYVPLYILRVPVRYYRQPPVYFRDWQRDAPPRWGNHWGRDWEQQRRGWDKWKRSSAPARAPLPAYQKQYTGERYPRVEQQQDLHREHYRYQPRDKAVRQHFQSAGEQKAPPATRRERPEEQRMRGTAPQEIQRPQPQPRGPAFQEQRQEQRHEQRQQPRPQGQEQRFQERERQQEPRGQEREQRKDEGRGRGRDN